jgi:hypothetical protein
MPLTDAQKGQVRRHLKYPVIGLMSVNPAGGALGQASPGYRFFQSYGLLEYRMNNFQPSEEAMLLGLAIGGVAVLTVPNVGDTVSVTISGGPLAGPVTITTPPYASSTNDGRLVLCQQIANGVPASPALVAAGFLAYTPYGSGPFAQNTIPVPEVGIQNSLPFTVSASGTGATTPQVTSQGILVPPSTSLDGGVTILWGYMNILNGLEFYYATASDNLDTSKADVWTARSSELAQRKALYEHWVAMLSDFCGIPVNPDRRRQNDAERFGAMRFA